MQSNISKTDFTDFLQSGALLQLTSDRFKLIWGPFQEDALAFSDLSDGKTVIYKPDFWDFLTATDGLRVSFGSHEATLSKDRLLELCDYMQPEPAHVAWDTVATTDFSEQFQWSQKLFQTKTLLKTVPIIHQTGEAKITPAQLAHALKNLVQGNHYGTTYGFWSHGQGVLGHSPEIILEWCKEQKMLRTMALAGTTRVEDREGLLNDPKILNEHQIVVEDILSVLNATSTQAVDVQGPQVLGLKHLNHLLTNIDVPNVEGSLLEKYLIGLHPTAALGIYPREKECFLKFQKFPLQQQRKSFAAPFGFLTNEHVKVTAAIRSLFFSKDRVEIFSGCGVTEESRLQSELDELETKRNSVKRMMGLNL